MVMSGPGLAEGRGEALRKAKRLTSDAMMQNKEDKKDHELEITKSWIEQFKLAPQVEAVLQDRQEGDQEGPTSY